MKKICVMYAIFATFMHYISCIATIKQTIINNHI